MYAPLYNQGLLDGYNGIDVQSSAHSDDYGGAYEDEEMRAPIFNKKKNVSSSGKRTHYVQLQDAIRTVVQFGSREYIHVRNSLVLCYVELIR